jgi:glycosyltransferase involved in cell wall biosynthesis
MAQYGRDADAAYRVLDQHNAVYLVFDRLARGEGNPVRRAVLRREARQLSRYEARQVESFDRVLFVTRNDVDALEAVSSPPQRSLLQERGIVMPICVDLEMQARMTFPRERAPHRVLVLGTMYWPPNAEGVMWLADNVLQSVLRAVPSAVLTVVGKNPPQQVRRLADRFGPSVEVLGYVGEEKLAAILSETAVFAVPLLSGGGMRVKILDAWAWGVPVLSTTIGAEGIQVSPGRDILLADDPESFAAEAVRLLREPATRESLASAGRATVEATYSVARVYDALTQVYAPVFDKVKNVEVISD